MNNTKLESQVKTAVSNALTGYLNGKDLLAIVRSQNAELGDISDVDAATLVLYQTAFN